MTNADFWIGPQFDRLKELHSQGLTFKAIGDIMGATRSAVAGACRRYKLPARRDPMRERKPKGQSKGSGKKKLVGKATPPQPVKPQPVVIPEPEPLMLRLEQLDHGQCKWSVSDRPHLFCGAAALPMKAWCAHHYGRVYQSEEAARQQARVNQGLKRILPRQAPRS